MMPHVIEYFAKSLKIIQSDTLEYDVCKSLSIVTMSLSRTVSTLKSRFGVTEGH